MSGLAGSFAARWRLAVGVACVASAAIIVVEHAGSTVSSLDGQLTTDAYIHDSLTRVVTTGDGLGIPYALQVAALEDIPSGSSYALLLPASQAVANVYGIDALAFGTAPAWFTYLLLPDEPAAASAARYVICWGCDTAPWDPHTDWLWEGQGEAVGRVRS